MSEARGDGALPAPQAPRASDLDRTAVVDRLREAAGDGAITLDELEARLAAAYAATTLPELAVLAADLPAPAPEPAPPAPTGAMADPAFRVHLRAYLLVIGMLVGIWLLGGAGHPWPFYPAAGWGIGLGLHHLAASRRDPAPDEGARRLPPAPGPALGRPAHERRFVVAMFVDVVGSTALNEALGDQRWAEVRHAFRRRVRDVATAHGGWEVSTSGDGVLVRFHEPAAAADAACGLLADLERQRAETGFAPSVRVGIHSGDAVEDGDDIIGNVVNLAARVTDAADADEILVTEHVADHLGTRHTTDGRGLRALKGISRPRHLLALVWR